MAGSNKIVGITIDIEGKTSGLTKSLKEANSSIAKTTSAMRDLDKAIALDPKNVELLTQKQELLTGAISDTEKKLETMKQVAEDAAKGLEAGTVSKEQYASLTAELVKTEASLKSLKEESQQTADALEHVGDPEAVEEIDEIGDQAEETGKQMDDAGVKIDLFGSVLTTLTNPAAVAAAGLGAVIEVAKTAVSVFETVAGAVADCAEAIGTTLYEAAKDGVDMLSQLELKLAGYTKQGASYADNINTLAQKTNMTTDEVQKLQYAAELVDTSFETISGAMTKNLKSMDKAAQATEEKMNEVAITYENLGIDIFNDEGMLRNSTDVFWEVIEALEKIEDPTDRDITAMTLLGKSAKELNPLIKAGASEMERLGKMAEESGYILDKKTLDSYQQFDDQLKLLDNGITSLENGLGLIFLPLLSSLAGDGVQYLNEFSKGVSDADGDIKKIGEVIKTVLPKAISAVMNNLPDFISITSELIQTVLQSIIDNLPVIIDGISQIITMLGNTLLSAENVEKITSSVMEIIQIITQFFIDHGAELIQLGTQVIVGLVNGIATALPKLIPAMAEAVTTIVKALTEPETLNALINAAIVLILALAQGISDAMPQLLEAIPPLVEALCTAISVLAPLITEVGLQLFEALLNSGTITDTIDTLAPLILDLIVQIGGKLVEFGSRLPGYLAQAFLSLGDEAFSWGVDLIAQMIAGIKSMFDSLWDTCKSAAQGIADFLGFSVPEKGPLHEWAYNNPGADMIDLFASGIEDELPELRSALDLSANVINDTMSQDYTPQLSEISSGVQSLTTKDSGQIVIPVYIGDERIQTLVVDAGRTQTYLSGGR